MIVTFYTRNSIITVSLTFSTTDLNLRTVFTALLVYVEILILTTIICVVVWILIIDTVYSSVGGVILRMVTGVIIW